MKKLLHAVIPGILSVFRKAAFLVLALLTLHDLQAQTPRQMEMLDRGLVAVRSASNQVYVGWRMLGTDPASISFNVYRDGIKLNSAPISNSTNYVDNTSSNSGAYTVRAGVEGKEQAATAVVNVWTQPYRSIPLQVPTPGKTPSGEDYTYSPNDCSVGDLDGDGQYEIVLKWDPSNSKDNSQNGYTGNVFLDAYELDGSHLWRIDLGRNIRAGAHYTQFMVYDLDGDGKAEIACKTADGTVDGMGQVIGNVSADYRNSDGRVLSGPEFLTVFNGETGAAMATTDFLPARGTVSSWGDNYGNRVDRFIAAIAYLDGSRPSLIMGRGYYTRLVRVAWDWRDGKLTQRWIFDSNTTGNGSYAGQGNHQMTVGDVDGDGKDEIFNGSSAIDDDGTALWTDGKGHGDALHLSDMDPSVEGEELWMCHEEPSRYGTTSMTLRKAKTGELLWGVPGTGDIGRAMAADIDPRYPGYEVWGATGGLYSIKGEQISTSRPSMNFGIWWDDDLSRELLDGVKLDKWNPSTAKAVRLMTLSDYGSANSNNTTKANPCLTADILGDWREEILLRSNDNKNLLLFTTTIPTATRIYTLMHDPQYRVAVAWQNSGYNQPPHPGFFLGTNMSTPPVPNIQLVSSVPSAPDFSLPASNFKVSVLSETCRMKNNGKIQVEAVSGAYTYRASLKKGSTVSNYNFDSKTLNIESLSAGTYELRLMVTEHPSYEQTYNLTVSEPSDLSVYTDVNTVSNIVDIKLSGANRYLVELNGQVHTTTANRLSLDLDPNGINVLKVSSDMGCQDVIERILTPQQGISIYPNPTAKYLSISKTADLPQITELELVDLSGRAVYRNNPLSGNEPVQIDLSHLSSGIYLLKLSSSDWQSTFKIVKK